MVSRLGYQNARQWHFIPNLLVVVLETDAESTCDAYGAVSERQAKRELKAVPR